MLDDVERRRFLVKPSGEHPVPALVRLLDVDLDEGAGQLFLLPRSGRLARPKPHDHILPPHRLAGMERHRLDDAVALVEHAQHRHALGHGSDSALPIRGRSGLPRRWQRGIFALLLAARDERERGEERCAGGSHAYSGIQGS
jgi:hypothetical protein